MIGPVCFIIQKKKKKLPVDENFNCKIKVLIAEAYFQNKGLNCLRKKKDFTGGRCSLSFNLKKASTVCSIFFHEPQQIRGLYFKLFNPSKPLPILSVYWLHIIQTGNVSSIVYECANDNSRLMVMFKKKKNTTTINTSVKETKKSKLHPFLHTMVRLRCKNWSSCPM